MRIGLSLLTHEGQNIWNNGIGQNVFHLACALAAVPFVEKVLLVNTGDQQATPPGTSGIRAQPEDRAARRRHVRRPAAGVPDHDRAGQIGRAHV